MRRVLILFTFIIACGLLGISGAQIRAQGEAVPRFEDTACKFDVPRAGTRCGDLIVREDRSDPNSPTIRLHVGIIPPLDPANEKPDPVVYLDGGPGGWALIFLSFRTELINMFRDRTLIVFDQRGVGYSEPALDCPELIEFYFAYLNIDIPMDESEWLAAQELKKCRNRLAASGVNLSAYNSAESAADLDELRQVLGYDQWNLYGISYGTRLGLTAIRDFPGGVRSLVIDSVLPPQVDNLMEVPRLANNVYRALFDACAADAVCNEEYPDLERVFYELADRLDAEPVTVRVRNPIDNLSYEMLINGYAVRNMMFSALYATSTIPTIPRMIYEAYEGDFSAMAEEMFINIVSFEFFSIGMYYSVNCTDEIAFRTMADFIAADEPYPYQKNAFDSQFYFKNCQIWDVPLSDPIETQPVTSDVPTLLISGQYDPITPPEYAEMAHQTLSNSYNYVFPAMGHGTSFDSPCAAGILVAFVENPTQEPDTSCIAGMPGIRFQRR